MKLPAAHLLPAQTGEVLESRIDSRIGGQGVSMGAPYQDLLRIDRHYAVRAAFNACGPWELYKGDDGRKKEQEHGLIAWE